VIDMDIFYVPSSVQAEGDLVTMHHDVGNVTIVACGVGNFAAQEDTCIRVHGCLVLGNGLVQLKDDDALRVVEQILAHTRNILYDRDIQTR
jgi:hypothetical protein